MQSKDNLPNALPFIFAGMDGNAAAIRMSGIKCYTKHKPKEIWLIRESASFKGMLALSYCDGENENGLDVIMNKRIGFVGNEWQSAPTLDINELNDFVQQADFSFSSSNTIAGGVDNLLAFLEKDGFLLQDQILPDRSEVTKNSTYDKYIRRNPTYEILEYGTFEKENIVEEETSSSGNWNDRFWAKVPQVEDTATGKASENKIAASSEQKNEVEQPSMTLAKFNN